MSMLQSIAQKSRTHTESVYPFRRAGTKKNIEAPNIIHWCGARQLALFLTLEHCKNMLAAGIKGGRQVNSKRGTIGIVQKTRELVWGASVVNPNILQY